MSLAAAIAQQARWLESLLVSNDDLDAHEARIELAWRAVVRARDEERAAAVTIPRISIVRGAA